MDSGHTSHWSGIVLVTIDVRISGRPVLSFKFTVRRRNIQSTCEKSNKTSHRSHCPYDIYLVGFLYAKLSTVISKTPQGFSTTSKSQTACYVQLIGYMLCDGQNCSTDEHHLIHLKTDDSTSLCCMTHSFKLNIFKRTLDICKYF